MSQLLWQTCFVIIRCLKSTVNTSALLVPSSYVQTWTTVRVGSPKHLGWGKYTRKDRRRAIKGSKCWLLRTKGQCTTRQVFFFLHNCLGFGNQTPLWAHHLPLSLHQSFSLGMIGSRLRDKAFMSEESIWHTHLSRNLCVSSWNNLSFGEKRYDIMDHSTLIGDVLYLAFYTFRYL